MKHKYILSSLPLLASVLGRKYGIRVRIGGDKAFTDGNTIQLPSLPVNCDDTLLGLVRGMIDHEAAHVRDTDFQALKAANLSPLEKHIWNTVEDWRVENKLAAIFPGCRANFQWLIKHFFLPKPPEKNLSGKQTDTTLELLDWLLITVRSWDVPELAPERNRLRANAEIYFPGLTHEIEPILRSVRARCSSTQDAISAALAITTILKRYVHFLQQQQTPRSSGQGNSAKDAETDNHKSGQVLQSLQKLLTSSDADLPSDLGNQVKELISGACNRKGTKVHVAVPVGKPTGMLPQHIQDATRQATTALRTRLTAMMQSMRSVRNCSGFAGKLNTHKLHKLAAHDGRIFLRRSERRGTNTAVHILLDASGSMNGTAMDLAGQACFAVASSLNDLKGINLGVTAFPGAEDKSQSGNPGQWRTVSPILKHNQKMHTRFSLRAGGGTPMDAALWWTLQQLHLLPEPRKMILLITDGDPDDQDAAKEAIKTATALGVELYGIGIHSLSVTNLLPDQRCRVISTLSDLAPAMLSLLHNALIPTK